MPHSITRHETEPPTRTLTDFVFLHIDYFDQENQRLEILERKGGKGKRSYQKEAAGSGNRRWPGKKVKIPARGKI